MAEDFEPPNLASALEAQDPVAVAFAIRNGQTIVPLLPVDGPDQVRVFRREDADKYMLLLFSSAESYARMLPQETDLRSVPYGRTELREYLETNIGVLELVWFDVAGPHPMQAAPTDLLDALTMDGS